MSNITTDATGKKVASVQLLVKNNTSSKLDEKILGRGEPAFATDTYEFGIGDGSTKWSALQTRVKVSDRLFSSHTINGISFDGQADVRNVVVCTTAADVNVKKVEVQNFVETSGAYLLVRFEHGNTNTGEIKLQVNETGNAYPIYFKNSAISADFIDNTLIYTLVLLDGRWYYVGIASGVSGNALIIDSDGKIRSDLSISYDSANQKIHLNANGNSISSFDVSHFVKDAFLKNVVYDASTHKLKFTWNIAVDNDSDETTESVQETEVDLSELVDTPISSDNVVFSKDLVYTADIGVLKLNGASNKTLDSKNKTLTEVFQSIMSSVTPPSTTKMSPTVTFATVGNIEYQTNTVGNAFTYSESSGIQRSTKNDTQEIGNNATAVSVKTTFKPGTYEYGYWLNDGNDNISSSATGSQSTDQTATFEIQSTAFSSKITGTPSSSGTTTKITFTTPQQLTSTSQTYTLTNNITSTNSIRYPLDNLGSPAKNNDGTLMQPISGTTYPKTATFTLTGYRRCFYYVGTDTTSTITGEFIRNNAVSIATTTVSASSLGTIEVLPTTRRIILAVPGTWYLESVIDMNNNANVVMNFTRTTTTIAGANSYTGSTYSVFECNNGSNPIAKTSYKITLSSKEV